MSFANASLPTAVHVTFGARLTLPASTAEETVRGTGRQVRLLRAPSLEMLGTLVARELRAHALSHCGEVRSAKGRAAKGGASADLPAVAAEVLAALDAGDLPRAARAHAEGFALPVELPPQFGGVFGSAEQIPTPVATRARLAADRQAALMAELDAMDADAESGELAEPATADEGSLLAA